MGVKGRDRSPGVKVWPQFGDRGWVVAAFRRGWGDHFGAVGGPVDGDPLGTLLHLRRRRTPGWCGIYCGVRSPSAALREYQELEPEEVAAMAWFIATEATFSTGSEFIVDGGELIVPLPAVARS